MSTKGRRPSSGGDALFEETYRTLSPWLQRKLAHRLGAGRSDIDDLVQESFLRLHRYAPDDRSRHPRALLWRIAGNVARDAFRRERARGSGNRISIDEIAADHLSQPSDQHATLALKQAILALPEPLRDVFVLARFTPLTNTDIAQHFGISVKTVEWRLAKAVAFCLDRLTD